MEIPERVGDYVIGCVLGNGSSSTVFQVFHAKTKKWYAAKFIPREIFSQANEYLRHVESELRILERIDHPNIAKYHETIYLEHYIVIITELLINGTLTQLCSLRTKLPEPMIYRFIQQIAGALVYLHDRGIYHRDIKPENIAFDENMNAKLIDFGFCVESPKNTINLACGTPYYIAPEVIYSDTYDGDKADMWSFGITLYYLINHHYPFEECSTKDYIKMLGKLREFTIPGNTNVKTILEGLLQIDPTKRFSAEQLYNSSVFGTDNNIRSRSISLPLMASKHMSPKANIIVRPNLTPNKSYNSL